MNSSSSYYSSCEHVPLSQYNWIYAPPNPCGLPWNATVYSLVAAFNAVTFWIGLELVIELFLRFQRRWTMYFWSILISICGTVGWAISNLLIHNPRLALFGLALQIIGSTLSITGFSFMLFSRLHLVVFNKRLLRIILYSIIATAILLQTPIVVVAALAPIKYMPSVWRIVFSFDFVFSFQECILASIYIWHFFNFTKDIRGEPRVKSTLVMLIAAEAVVLLADIACSVLMFMQWYLAKELINAFSYAIKIKIEFVVLNALIRFSQYKQKHFDTALEVHGSEKMFAGSAMDASGKGSSCHDVESAADTLCLRESVVTE